MWRLRLLALTYQQEQHLAAVLRGYDVGVKAEK